MSGSMQLSVERMSTNLFLLSILWLWVLNCIDLSNCTTVCQDIPCWIVIVDMTHCEAPVYFGSTYPPSMRQISCIHVFCCWQPHLSPSPFGEINLLLDNSFPVTENASSFCVWLDSCAGLRFCWTMAALSYRAPLRAAAPYVLPLIELFLGSVKARSARQSPLIFLNDVASVSVNLGATAARRGLLWLTSLRDKQSRLTDEWTITSTPPENISATSEPSQRINNISVFTRLQMQTEISWFVISFDSAVMTVGIFGLSRFWIFFPH